MTTMEQAERIAGDILQAFEADMKTRPNACGHCGRRVEWPCEIGFVYLGAGQLVVYPLCQDCAEKARGGAT